MLEFNRLVEIYTNASIAVGDTYWGVRQPGESAYGYKTTTYAFVFPVTGRAKFVFDGVLYELSPGKVLHSPPGMRLDKCVIGAVPWENYVLHYSFTAPIGEKEQELLNIYEIETGENPKIRELLRIIYQISKEPGALPAFRAKQLFYTLLEELFTGYRHLMNQDHEASIKDALAYIHTHYMEPLALEQIANRFQMRSEQFSYSFHKYTGMRPIHYLIMHRMKIAEELLRMSHCTVVHAAESVGYTDAYYFSRLFKKYKGVCPSELKHSFQDHPL